MNVGVFNDSLACNHGMNCDPELSFCFTFTPHQNAMKANIFPTNYISRPKKISDFGIQVQFWY